MTNSGFIIAPFIVILLISPNLVCGQWVQDDAVCTTKEQSCPGGSRRGCSTDPPAVIVAQAGKLLVKHTIRSVQVDRSGSGPNPCCSDPEILFREVGGGLFAPYKAIVRGSARSNKCPPASNGKAGRCVCRVKGLVRDVPGYIPSHQGANEQDGVLALVNSNRVTGEVTGEETGEETLTELPTQDELEFVGCRHDKKVTETYQDLRATLSLRCCRRRLRGYRGYFTLSASSTRVLDIHANISPGNSPHVWTTTCRASTSCGRSMSNVDSCYAHGVANFFVPGAHYISIVIQGSSTLISRVLECPKNGPASKCKCVKNCVATADTGNADTDNPDANEGDVTDPTPAAAACQGDSCLSEPPENCKCAVPCGNGYCCAARINADLYHKKKCRGASCIATRNKC